MIESEMRDRLAAKNIEIDRLRSELASAQTIAARESAEADVQVESRIEAQEELFTARTEIETLRKRIAELEQQADFHVRMLTGGGSAAYLGELAEAYRLRDAHHTDAIDARLETESLRDELTAKDARIAVLEATSVLRLNQRVEMQAALEAANARIAELDAQNQQMFTASCNLANDLQDARESIAVLEGLVSQGISGEHAALIRAERAEAERDRLGSCLLAIHAAKEDVPASVLRSVAYDAALNCITSDVAEFQIERRAALDPSPAGREG